MEQSVLYVYVGACMYFINSLNVLSILFYIQKLFNNLPTDALFDNTNSVVMAGIRSMAKTIWCFSKELIQ